MVLRLAERGGIRTHTPRGPRRRVIGDIYDPGTDGRLQIRDDWGRIVGYIQRDGIVRVEKMV